MYSPALTKQRITTTEENKTVFDCNIVNNNFCDFLYYESTAPKGTINTGNRHIDKKEV